MGARDLKLQGRFDYQPILVGFNAIIPKAQEFRRALDEVRAVEAAVGQGLRASKVGASGRVGGDTGAELAHASALKLKAMEDVAFLHAKVGVEAEKAAVREVRASNQTADAEVQKAVQTRAAVNLTERESNRVFKALEAQYKRDQKAFQVSEAQKRAEMDATAAKFRAAAEVKKNEPAVYIHNREKLANYGPVQGPVTAGEAAAAEKYRVAQEERQQQARETTWVYEREAKKRVDIKAREAYELTAHDKLLLREEKRFYVNRASGENDFFQRQRQTLRAQTLYLRKLHADDAQMIEAITKAHLAKLEAINNREKGFANTPFQKHIGMLGQLLGKMGLSAGQAGQAVQLAGYQIGDFAVQVGSGQSAMRAFLQQAPQFLQIFGKFGVYASIGVSVLGALWMILKKNKEEAKGFADTSLPDWLQRPESISSTVKAFEDLSRAREDFAKQKGAPQLITDEHGRQVLNYVEALDRATAAEAAFSKATGKTAEEFKKTISQYMTMPQLIAAAQQIMYAQQIDALEEYNRAVAAGMAEGLQKSIEQEKAAHRAKIREAENARTKVLLDQKASDEDRQKAQADFVVKSAALEATHRQNLENLRSADLKKTKEKAKEAREAILAAEAQTQRMRIETQMVGSARSVALVHAEYHERVRAAKGNAQEIAQIEQQRALALEALQVAASRREMEELRRVSQERQALEQRRLESLHAGNEAELLAIRQQAESRRLEEEYNAQLIRDVQEGNYAVMEARYAAHQDALTATAFIHEQERQQLATKTIEENAKKQAEAYRLISSGLMTIGNEFANTFNVRPMQRALSVLQQILAVIEATKSVSKGLNLLGGLVGGIGLFSGAMPAAAIMPGILDALPVPGNLAKSTAEVPTFLAKPTVPETVVPASVYTPLAKPTAASSASVTVQGMTVHVNLPEGTTPKQAEELGAAAARGAASGVGYLATQKAFVDTSRDASYNRAFG